jgi:hypothetical protein
MPNPNISAATAALRQDAGVWDRNADRLTVLIARVESLRMTDLEAGMFIMMIDAYRDVVDVISGRCREGAQSATEVAGALRQVTDVYDAEEAASLHAVLSLY